MNERSKQILKWGKYIAIIIAVAIIWNSARSCQSTQTTDHQFKSQYASSYGLYINDQRVEINGRTREFTLTGASAKWVSLSSVETYALPLTILGQTGIKCKTIIGFNPRTLRGVWQETKPDKGALQQGDVILVPSTHGGYIVKFTYGSGQKPSKGTLVPNW